MKKIIILISLFTIVFLSCSQVNPTATLQNQPELSEDLFSYEFLMDGYRYQFPILYSQLKENGWTQENEEEMLTLLFQNGPPRDFNPVGYVEHNKIKIPVMYSNIVLDETGSQIAVVSMYWDNKTLEKLNITFPQNITHNSTRDDIVNLLGLADDMEFYGSYEILTYNHPTGLNGPMQPYIKFIIDKNENLEGILMKCIYNPNNFDENALTIGLSE